MCRCFGYMVSKKKYIDTINDDCFVFSAFGFVHKIATFEKAAGIDPVHRCSHSFCSKRNLRWKKHSELDHLIKGGNSGGV
ncbi:hypothetical protein E2562_030452 [Oryza meyeriana var. granulata]|uniref:Uncharacterized protein n=1 Tax=Oryza meyeriana var. granulata TaxID=110450 RepID=A0A6G1BMW6_9ORYZ|nr:hypothetical protein E2562_030452 [Oryza meyeriana var. granulata]